MGHHYVLEVEGNYLTGETGKLYVYVYSMGYEDMGTLIIFL
jgi:hypothetical protein